VRSSARAGLTLFEHPTALVTYVLLTGTGTFIILYAMCCTSQAKGYGRLADLEEGKPRASHTPKSVPKTALERQHPPPPKPAEPRPTKPVDLSERGKLRVLLQRAEGLNDARALLLGKSDPYVILKAGALGALLLPHLPSVATSLSVRLSTAATSRPSMTRAAAWTTSGWQRVSTPSTSPSSSRMPLSFTC
jgi:hypothetical protein